MLFATFRFRLWRTGRTITVERKNMPGKCLFLPRTLSGTGKSAVLAAARRLLAQDLPYDNTNRNASGWLYCLREHRQ